MTNQTKEPRIGISGATDMNPSKAIWQHVLTVLKNIRKDILVFLAVLEFVSFLGTGIFIVCAVNLAMRNTPILLNGLGLVAVGLSGLGVILSFLQGYWEHLLRREGEWER